MKRVAFVMVNHNGGEEVLESARSLLADMGEDDLLILVDNGCTDGSGEAVVRGMPLSRSRKGMQVVRFVIDENLTYAEANNRGVRWALKEKFRYIGLINPDVRIKTGMTERLVRKLLMGKGKTAAVSPVMLYERPWRRIWYAGGKIWWPFAWTSHRGQGKSMFTSYLYEKETEYLSGCCLLAPADAWRKVGPLSKRYGMYSEDVDWSWRARKCGDKLEVVGDAILVHRISQSSGGGRTDFKMKYRTLSSRLFFRRHTPSRYRGMQVVLKYVPFLLYSLMLLLRGEKSALRAFIRAFFQPLGDRVPWPPAR